MSFTDLHSQRESAKNGKRSSQTTVASRTIVPKKLNTEKIAVQKAAELILESVGEDLNREGLLRTPERFAKAIRELCSGYQTTKEQAIGAGVFPAESTGVVSVKHVEFHSMCEHHLLPFFGCVSVAYYPNKKILGLSKIPRIIEMYARRFQVQERLTQQIAQTIQESIDARAVLVRATGEHLCMKMRGVESENSETTTEVVLGLENLTPDEKSRLFTAI